MEITAEAILQSYSMNARQHMARAHGLDGKNKNSEALTAILVPALFDTGHIQGALEGLSPAERLLVDRLLLLGADAPTGLLQRQLEQAGMVDQETAARDPWRVVEQGAKGSPTNTNSRRFSDVVARLGALGLVYSRNPGQRGLIELTRPGYRLYIPDAVAALLPRPAPAPIESVAPPSLVRLADTAALLRDIFVFLSAVTERPLPLTKAGQIQKRWLTQLGPLLHVKEDIAAARSQDDLTYLPFVRALGEAAGLLLERPGELRAGEGTAAFLAEPRSRRRQRLYDAYRTTDQWSEIFQTEAAMLHTAGGRLPVPDLFVAARQRVLAALAALPVERWISLATFVERIRETDYEFLFRREYVERDYYTSFNYYGAPNPYNGQNAAGWSFDAVYREADGWDAVEAPFIRAVVTLAFAWLGGVDLGYEGGQPVAFRLTANGARLLRGDAPTDTDVAAPNVVVQPNFQVFAFEPTDESVLFRLNAIAERVRVDQASEYRLTRDSIYHAQRAGWDVAAILGFLDEVSNVPLPQNVRRSIEEWGAEQERVTFRRDVGLLQAVDGATLAAAAADPAVAALLSRRLTPTIALVSQANVSALFERLLAQDQFPALSEGVDIGLTPAFQVEADGTLVFHDPAPSFYAVHAVAPFVAGRPPEPTRLTRESLRRAAKQGLTPAKILEILASQSAKPLPAEIPALVERWAKDWGRGALAEVTLLQVEDAATLTNLREDPAIRRYVTPLPAAPTLAVVRPDGVAAVRAALVERGIEPEGALFI